MSEDIEFCTHSECTNKRCERHPSQIKQKWFDHSFMDLRGIICKGWSTAESFGWKCPYTDKHCNTFDCSHCKRNDEERRWMEESEGESRIVTDDRWVVSADGTLNDMWMKRIEAIKDEIHRYWLDCDFAVDDKVCKECGKNVFWSILRIIDKHTKGETDGHN